MIIDHTSLTEVFSGGGYEDSAPPLPWFCEICAFQGLGFQGDLSFKYMSCFLLSTCHAFVVQRDNKDDCYRLKMHLLKGQTGYIRYRVSHET